MRPPNLDRELLVSLVTAAKGRAELLRHDLIHHGLDGMPARNLSRLQEHLDALGELLDEGGPDVAA